MANITFLDFNDRFASFLLYQINQAAYIINSFFQKKNFNPNLFHLGIVCERKDRSIFVL